MEERAEPAAQADRHLDLQGADAYGRSFADVYDRWYNGVSDAVATARFVAARCRGRAVLELGVGTGRLAGPLVEQGLTVIGLDGSASMLDLCPRPRLLHLVRADMRALPFGGSIGAALIAFNTLFNLSSETEQLGLLIELRRLMEPEGVVIIEALDVTALSTGPAASIGIRDQSDHGLVVTATQLDADRQTITGQHLEIADDGVSVRPWRLRWLSPTQLDDLAGQAGLALAERYRGWSGEPITAPGDSHISVYRPRPL